MIHYFDKEELDAARLTGFANSGLIQRMAAALGQTASVGYKLDEVYLVEHDNHKNHSDENGSWTSWIDTNKREAELADDFGLLVRKLYKHPFIEVGNEKN